MAIIKGVYMVITKKEEDLLETLATAVEKIENNMDVEYSGIIGSQRDAYYEQLYLYNLVLVIRGEDTVGCL